VVPAFFGNAFFIFMYRQFIAQIPESLVEAARVDGLGLASRIWWRIILPLCRPVTAICAVFTFIGTWNDFLGPAHLPAFRRVRQRSPSRSTASRTSTAGSKMCIS
jgi:ABC-type glycerol-3-phosphate transport system permease component